MNENYTIYDNDLSLVKILDILLAEKPKEKHQIYLLNVLTSKSYADMSIKEALLNELRMMEERKIEQEQEQEH